MYQKSKIQELCVSREIHLRAAARYLQIAHAIEIAGFSADVRIIIRSAENAKRAAVLKPSRSGSGRARHRCFGRDRESAEHSGLPGLRRHERREQCGHPTNPS